MFSLDTSRSLRASEQVHTSRASWELPNTQKPHVVQKVPQKAHKLLRACIYRNYQQKLPLFLHLPIHPLLATVSSRSQLSLVPSCKSSAVFF